MMLKMALLLALLGMLVAPQLVVAQEPVVLDPSTEHYTFAHHAEFLLDEGGTWSIEDVVAKRRAGEFKPFDKDILRFRRQATTCWIRLSVEIEPGQSDWVLIPGSVLTDSVEVYSAESQGQFQKTTLRRTAWSGLGFRDYLFKLPSSGTHTLYIRAHDNWSLIVAPTVMSRVEHVRQTGALTTIQFVNRSFFLALAIFNLLIGLFLRERTFTLFGAFLCCAVFTQGKFVPMYLVGLSPSLEHVPFLASAATTVLGLLFLRDFLETHQLPRTDMVFRGVVMIFVALVVVHFILLLFPASDLLRTVNGLLRMSSASFGLVALYIIVVQARKGLRSARVAIIAFTPTLLKRLLTNLILLWPSPEFVAFMDSPWFLFVNVSTGAWAVLLFSLGITGKMVLLRDAKQRAESLVMASQRLQRYLPRALTERILAGSHDVNLTSTRRNITIVFSDLKGFTALTDATEPERMKDILNHYMGEMLQLIEKHGGTLDKMMGDGIMMYFGAPDDMNPPDQSRQAVQMAVQMQRRMTSLGVEWRDAGFEHELELRIGIHQDYATVGNFGSEVLMEYTAIGSSVNFASRLESGCTPGKILVSQNVFAHTKAEFNYRTQRQQKFKGFSRPFPVAELDPSDVAPNNIESVPPQANRPSWVSRPPDLEHSED